MSCRGRQLDTRVRVVTPENIAFEYQVAGPFRRLPAYLIDLVIRVLACVAIFVGLMFALGPAGLGGLALGVSLIVWFVVDWFYGGLFETFWNGQTPGKRLTGLRVLSIDGRPINGLQAVLRNILRAADVMPVFFQTGLIAATMNDRAQRLGDLVCGTMVIVEQPQSFRGLLRLAEPDVARLAEQLPRDFVVSRPLARALAMYVERRFSLHWARRVQIAGHLAEPLRRRFHLPPGGNPDLLLCALYQRTFVTEQGSAAAPASQR